MKNKNISEWKVAGIAACVTCLLYTSGFLVIFTPFPLYFVSTVHGRRAGKIAVIISFAAAFLFYMLALPVFHGLAGQWSLAKFIFLLPGAGLADFFNVGSAQYFGLLYLAYFLMFGYLFSEGMEKKWSLNKWFATSVGATFGFLALAVLIPEFIGVPIFEGMQKYMHSMLNDLVAAQEAAGVDGSRVFAIRQNTDHIVRFSLNIVPSVVFLLGLVVASVNQLLARWMIKVPAKFAHFGDVARFSLPHYFVWITIALGFLFFLERYIFHAEWLRVTALNGLIVCGGVYFLQGLVIVSFYLRRLSLRWFRAAAYIMMFLFIQVTAPVVAVLGFTDLWIDFRRLVRKKEDKKRSVPWK